MAMDSPRIKMLKRYRTISLVWLFIIPLLCFGGLFAFTKVSVLNKQEQTSECIEDKTPKNSSDPKYFEDLHRVVDGCNHNFYIHDVLDIPMVFFAMVTYCSIPCSIITYMFCFQWLSSCIANNLNQNRKKIKIRAAIGLLFAFTILAIWYLTGLGVAYLLLLAVAFLIMTVLSFLPQILLIREAMKSDKRLSKRST